MMCHWLPTSWCILNWDKQLPSLGAVLPAIAGWAAMQKSVPCQGDTRSNFLTTSSGWEAWVPQEVGGMPEGPAHLGLPATEEHTQREGCLGVGSSRPVLTAPCASLWRDPYSPLPGCCCCVQSDSGGKDSWEKGCLRRDSQWGVGGSQAVSWASWAVLCSLTRGPVGIITLAPCPWLVSRQVLFIYKLLLSAHHWVYQCELGRVLLLSDGVHLPRSQGARHFQVFSLMSTTALRRGMPAPWMEGWSGFVYSWEGWGLA